MYRVKLLCCCVVKFCIFWLQRWVGLHLKALSESLHKKYIHDNYNNKKLLNFIDLHVSILFHIQTYVEKYIFLL